MFYAGSLSPQTKPAPSRALSHLPPTAVSRITRGAIYSGRDLFMDQIFFCAPFGQFFADQIPYILLSCQHDRIPRSYFESYCLTLILRTV